jgi:hypothetical protein
VEFIGVDAPAIDAAEVRCGVLYADNADGGTLSTQIQAVALEQCTVAGP